MVLRPTSCPMFDRAPRIRVYPHDGFSLAILTTNVAISGSTVGRPSFPRLPSYFFATSCRCQRSKRVGRDERADLPQRAPANELRLRRQAAALRVGEPEPPRPEPIAENPVLLAEVVDDRRLLPVGPAGQRREHQMEWLDEHGSRIVRNWESSSPGSQPVFRLRPIVRVLGHYAQAQRQRPPVSQLRLWPSDVDNHERGIIFGLLASDPDGCHREKSSTRPSRDV